MASNAPEWASATGRVDTPNSPCPCYAIPPDHCSPLGALLGLPMAPLIDRQCDACSRFSSLRCLALPPLQPPTCLCRRYTPLLPAERPPFRCFALECGAIQTLQTLLAGAILPLPCMADDPVHSRPRQCITANACAASAASPGYPWLRLAAGALCWVASKATPSITGDAVRCLPVPCVDSLALTCDALRHEVLPPLLCIAFRCLPARATPSHGCRCCATVPVIAIHSLRVPCCAAAAVLAYPWPAMLPFRISRCLAAIGLPGNASATLASNPLLCRHC